VLAGRGEYEPMVIAQAAWIAEPIFSPDDQCVACFDGQKLRLVSVAGGTVSSLRTWSTRGGRAGAATVTSTSAHAGGFIAVGAPDSSPHSSRINVVLNWYDEVRRKMAEAARN
jgi:hypothetical protein